MAKIGIPLEKIMEKMLFNDPKKQKKKMMIKRILILSLLFSSSFLLFSCANRVSDVSAIPPHDKLVGSIWKLKTDAYIIEYSDNKGVYLIIPCVDIFSGRLPNWSAKYDDKNIGKSYNSRKVIGGLKKGELLRIIRVLKDHGNYAVSEFYRPMAIPLKPNRWTENRELDLDLYYGGQPYGIFYDQGILNPEYAERIK